MVLFCYDNSGSYAEEYDVSASSVIITVFDTTRQYVLRLCSNDIDNFKEIIFQCYGCGTNWLTRPSKLRHNTKISLFSKNLGVVIKVLLIL